MGAEFELKYAATVAQQDGILKDLGDFALITMETT